MISVNVVSWVVITALIFFGFYVAGVIFQKLMDMLEDKLEGMKGG